MNHSTSVNNDGTNKCCEYKFVTIQKYFIDIGIVTARRCATCPLIDLQLTLSVKYLNSIIRSRLAVRKRTGLVFLACSVSIDLLYRLSRAESSLYKLAHHIPDRVHRSSELKRPVCPLLYTGNKFRTKLWIAPFHWCREFKKHAPYWFRFYLMDYFALSLEFYLSEVICWCY